MRKINVLMILLFVISFIATAQKSRKMNAKGEIGETKVKINYSAPSVKGRKVWGGLEAYGKVWRAGANKNTIVSFNKAVKVGGESLPAGKYGFFIIPNEKDSWVAIFNKRNADWGAYSYDQKEDALRVEITVDFVSETQEILRYSVGTNSIDFAWDKARLSIPIE